VIIDEIQKLPQLLNEVHDLIESRQLRFVLSGSSTAKLRRGGVNLLGGRARIRHLHPFVSAEVPGWDLLRAARVGGIPSVYFSDQPYEDLRAYAGVYLQMEVQAEALVRGIEPFSRFLAVAGMMSGEQLNFERVGSDAGVPARSVREFYQILQDTLLGELLPVFTAALPKRKPASHAKFYLFDVGLSNVLAGRTEVEPGTPSFGRALEHLVFCELRAWQEYRHDNRRLAFWRARDGSEVDFVIGDEIAIEVKGSASVADRDLAGLRRLAEETSLRRSIVVSLETAPRRVGNVDILPAREFLQHLWDGAIA
jgi:predicted AAA+ superfamily ATPase